MICPHCNHGINFAPYHKSGTYPNGDYDESGIGFYITYGFCPLCDELIVLMCQGECERADLGGGYAYEIEDINSESFLYPQNFVRTVEPEVPEAYKTDFLEACNVLNLSPKASAALSRRLLQNILREHFKIKQHDLAKEIDEFIQTKGAPSYLNDEIDAIRNVGNFAAHPLKSTSTGAIVDVESGEAEWLIEVLEGLFDFAFVQPARHTERAKRLNNKLADLGKPPLKKK